MDLRLYREILQQIADNNAKLQEIKDKIQTLTEIKSQRISDMPTGSLKYDNITALTELIDTEREVATENNILLRQARIHKKAINTRYSDKIQMLELFYIDNKTLKEIAEIMGKTYWCVHKAFRRME